MTKLFLTVIRAFVTNSAIDEAEKSQFTPDVLEKLYDLAKAHDVLPIVSDILFKNGLLPKGEEIAKKFHKQQLIALQRYMNITNDLQKIYNLFESNAIEFIPLKGSVIRQYYPVPYMRTSCDIDILVREEDLRRAMQLLVSSLQYKCSDTIDFHDVSLYSNSGVHLELHYNLKEKRNNLDKLLVKVWDHTVPSQSGKYHKLETPEFYIFHHISHMVNHFLRGGCGIRSFIDLYFIQKHMCYDAEKVAALMEESEISEFYYAAQQCVAVWFDGAASSQIVDLMESFILNGGVFGTRENRINLDQKKQGSKGRYFFSRIFIPYDQLKYKYPVLQKHRVLLPLMWSVRLISLLSPEKRRRAQNELAIHKGLSEEAIKAADQMLNMLQI